MIPKRLITGLDERRLRNVIALLFIGLAIPTAVLIWQAYGQLKWESFHQHRTIAEELTRRIDTRLSELIRAEDARSFADYSFIVVAGNPDASFVQRSPLSEYPVAAGMPGVLGHFQVDTDGSFSTPILPPEGTDAAGLGISESEYAARSRRAGEIRTVLAENRLVQSRPIAAVGASRSVASPQEQLEESEGEAAEAMLERPSFVQDSAPAVAAESYSQRVFDELNQVPDADAAARSREMVTVAAEPEDDMAQAAVADKPIGRVSDLRLDAGLERRSQSLERQNEDRKERAILSYSSGARSKRTEQAALPESVDGVRKDLSTNVVEFDELRITTFESEIDPFEFSLLDSGHIVLFRKVWRDGERYIQGLLLDQQSFLNDVIGRQFADTALSDMSNLIVANNDYVVRTFSGRVHSSYADALEALDGTLLYRNRLSAPLSSLELIFSINRLPPGAGASVLAWVTLILAVMFAGGFLVLYRLGLSQIRLARQQQDFVSAVSHELKTPLTSIRMYGEMLKEGWADEDKRQSYYEFIYAESERLSKLIENVLQLSRITRNDPQFDLKPISVGELMSNTQSKIANQIERAGFELRFDRDANADDATIEIDEDCFAQIVINLVDNAIKFSKNADTRIIEVESRSSGNGNVQFSVRDYGSGIPKDQMKKIFKLFYRSESELTRETVGTGIGLAIVHQLTQAMGGSVDLVNAEPGAEFRVLFPVASGPTAHA